MRECAAGLVVGEDRDAEPVVRESRYLGEEALRSSVQSVMAHGERAAVLDELRPMSKKSTIRMMALVA